MEDPQLDSVDTWLAIAADTREGIKTRELAVRALRAFADPRVRTALQAATNDPSARIREAAIQTLAGLPTRKGREIHIPGAYSIYARPLSGGLHARANCSQIPEDVTLYGHGSQTVPKRLVCTECLKQL